MDTEDSHYGAFSPPQMIGDNYVAPDAGFGTNSQGSQEETRGEVQSRANVGESQLAEQYNHQQSEIEKYMEMDQEAPAPAFKVPRAP